MENGLLQPVAVAAEGERAGRDEVPESPLVALTAQKLGLSVANSLLLALL